MLTDSGFGQLPSGAQSLTSLNLSECDKLTDAGILAVAERCTGPDLS